MNQDLLTDHFTQFGLALLIGFLIGMEREMSDRQTQNTSMGDFVFFALLGALAGYLSNLYDDYWPVLILFIVVSQLILAQYWADRKRDSSATTELAGFITFLLGVLLMQQQTALAVAIGIVTVVVLFQKQSLSRFKDRVQTHEMQAAVKFLVITFIILPVLPNQGLNHYLTTGVGAVTSINQPQGQLRVQFDTGIHYSEGDHFNLYGPRGLYRGYATIKSVEDSQLATASYHAEDPELSIIALSVRKKLGIEWLETITSAVNLYKLWLIVVLVSFVSLIGYLLIKVVGSAGIGLTGLIGGLVSSTVTTLSFARRSRENPELSHYFAGAVVLASSVMFPRLLLEIAVVDQALMKAMTLPILVMGVVGGLLALYEFLRHHPSNAENVPAMRFDNPFSLKSAISFAAIFMLILVLTHTATVYLGAAWLPLVAFVSGLTDADAIAFSLSHAHQSGGITTTWASFNLVIGTIANTLMKLFLIFTLGDRQLFYRVARSFILIALSGMITMFFYYDLSGAY